MGASHLEHGPHQGVRPSFPLPHLLPPLPLTLSSISYLSLTSSRAKNVQKIIPSDHKELLRGLVRYKEGLEGVMGYDHIQIPPVYKQVITSTNTTTNTITTNDTTTPRWWWWPPTSSLG